MKKDKIKYNHYYYHPTLFFVHAVSVPVEAVCKSMANRKYCLTAIVQRVHGVPRVSKVVLHVVQQRQRDRRTKNRVWGHLSMLRMLAN